MALLLLALVGVFNYDVDPRFLVAGAVLVVGRPGRRLRRSGGEGGDPIAGRLPVLRRFAHRFDESRSHGDPAAPGPLVVARPCWRRLLVLRVPGVLGRRARVPGRDIGLRGATFVYAATTVAGALSFLPGGLGVDRGGHARAAASAGQGIDAAAPRPRTFVTRAATLWFAVALGLPALCCTRGAST